MFWQNWDSILSYNALIGIRFDSKAEITYGLKRFSEQLFRIIFTDEGPVLDPEEALHILYTNYTE